MSKDIKLIHPRDLITVLIIENDSVIITGDKLL
jgi:hypothetical protein